MFTILVAVSGNLCAETSFSIPATSADKGLKLYAEQAGRQVLFPYDLMSRYATNAVQGSYDVDKALQILLDDTGLEAISDQSGTLTIRTFGDKQEKPAGKKTIFSGIADFLTSVFAVVPGRTRDQQETGVPVLEEITVTAQKRKQKLQDIGISVSAFSGEQLQDLGITRVDDLVELTAGVQMNNANGNTPTFVIRGVGIQDVTGNNAPAAALHLDGVYMASNINSGPQLFDIERAEILKGPQGTLYGRNNTAGTVNIITRKPSFENEGYISASYGEFDHAEIEGVVGGPVTDSVAYRVSACYELSDGFYDNVTFPAAPAPGPIFATAALGNTPLPAAADRDPGGLDIWSVRGQLLFEPNNTLSLWVKGHYAEDTSEMIPATFTGIGDITSDPLTFVQNPCPTMTFLSTGDVDGGTSSPACVDASGAVDPDPNDFDVSNNNTGEFDNQYYGAIIQADWDTAAGTVTALGAYEGFNWVQLGADYDGGPNLLDAGTRWDQALQQWSLELRLANDHIDNWYQLYGFYFSFDRHENDLNLRIDDNGNPADGAGLLCNFSDLGSSVLEPLFGFAAGALGAVPPAPGFGSCANVAAAMGLPGSGNPAGTLDLLQVSEQETTSIAWFTHHEWQFTATVKLTAGLRFTYEDRGFTAESSFEFDDDPAQVFIANAFGPILGGTPASTRLNPAIPDRILEHEISWQFGVEYSPADNLLIFAGVSQGFKSGGWDANIVIDGEILSPYEKETVTSYELGLKSDWLEGTMRFNATLVAAQYEQPQLRKNILIGGIPNTKLGNIDSADILALELEWAWSPTRIEGLKLMATASFLSTATEDLNNEIAVTNPDAVRLLDDRELAYAPNTAFALLGRYEWPVWSDNLLASVQAGGSYTGEQFQDISNQDFEEFDYWMVGARAAIRTQNDKWELAVWGRNLINDFYRQGTFGLFNARVFTFNRPRQFGVTLTYNFF